jgi:hypothetical protein
MDGLGGGVLNSRLFDERGIVGRTGLAAVRPPALHAKI